MISIRLRDASVVPLSHPGGCRWSDTPTSTGSRRFRTQFVSGKASVTMSQNRVFQLLSFSTYGPPA